MYSLYCNDKHVYTFDRLSKAIEAFDNANREFNSHALEIWKEDSQGCVWPVRRNAKAENDLWH